MNHLAENQIGLEKLSRSQWNIQTSYYVLNSQKPFHKWGVEKLAANSLKSAWTTSGTWTTFATFSWLENFPCLMQDCKISSNGLQIGLTHIFNMQIFIRSFI